MSSRARVERRAVPHREPAPGRPQPWHVHWFHRAGDDPLGPAGVYRCRCGQVRPGL